MAETTSLKQRQRAFEPEPQNAFIFDRFVLGLFLLAIAVAAAIALLTAIGAFTPSLVLPYGAELERWLRLDHVPYGLGRVLVAVCAALVGILAVKLLIRRISPASPRDESTTHVLLADDKGIVEVEKRGIATVAAEAVLRVSGVVEAEVEVLGSGAYPVRLRVSAWVHARTEMKRASDEVLEQAVQAVERLVGLDVHDAKVTLKVIPLEDLGRVVE
jgi:hypothetical protein